MATYVNDLRLKEIATGDEAGTWGTSTNTNLELIAEAMGHGAEAVANASTHTITMADGATDQFRSTFLRLTGGGQACTVTLAPNTLSHTWIMRNETAAALTLTQGSGANVAIAAGQTKIVATDGAGSGAIVYEMDDLELAGNLAVGGTLAVTGAFTNGSTLVSTGKITADAGIDIDNINIDGTTIALSSGDLTLDVAGDIILDADGGDVNFKDGGTEYLRVTNGASGPEIFSTSNDGDLFLKGVDGGATITALTLDMSAAGAATFNAGATFAGIGGVANIANDLTIFSSTSGHNGLRFHVNGILPTDNAGAIVDNDADLGDASYRFKDLHLSGSIVNSSDITLDAAGDIVLDADGQDIRLKDAGTEWGRFTHTGHFGIQNPVSDADILFLGNDGGSTITALTLDMSAAGAATFNSTISMGNLLNITDGTTTGFLSTTSGLLQFGLSTNHPILFYTNNTERVRINTSGVFLLGTTSAVGIKGGAVDENAVELGRGYININRDDTGNNRLLQFGGNGVTIGSIDAVSTGGGSIIIGNDSSGLMFRGDLTTSAFIPASPAAGVQVDNGLDVGHTAIRFDDIYATNANIQTSDRNEKQDIEELSEAEQRVAIACKGLLRKFRWIDAVQTKGDDARIHFGIIAQDLQAAFEAEGLDAGRYAMFISGTWWETQTEVAAVEATEDAKAVDAYTRTDTYHTAEAAPEGATERTRLGIRSSELLAFIISAL